MRQRLTQFARSEFAKSSFYTGIATLIKIVTMLLMSKLVAVYLGREGLGLIGQLTNFVTIALVLAGGCMNVGVVKYVAQYASSDDQKLSVFLQTGLTALLALSALCGILLIIFSTYWSTLVLNDPGFYSVFVAFGITIVFYGLNTFFISVINGFKKYRMLNTINVVTSILGLALSYILIRNNHIMGAFYAIVTNQSLVFFVTWLLTRKQHLMSRVPFRLAFNREQLMLLSKFILMTLVSTAFVPLVQLILRNYVIASLGLASAGIWEAVSRVSNVHLLFVTTTLSAYYLPRLSEIKLHADLRHEILRMLRIIVPLVILSSLSIYFLRHIVIKILFTADFNDAETLFGWQCVGDILKTAAWIIGYQMHAKGMTKIFIFTEVFAGMTYLFLSILFISSFGLVGASIAYAANYFVYLLVLVFIFRRILLLKSQNALH